MSVSATSSVRVFPTPSPVPLTIGAKTLKSCSTTPLYECVSNRLVPLIPFEISCSSPALQAKAKAVIQLLYSNQFSDSGALVWKSILGAFEKFSTNKTPFIIEIKDFRFSTPTALSSCTPQQRTITLDQSLITNLKLENGKQVRKVMGTILHEMTNAIRFSQFETGAEALAHSWLDEAHFKRDLGCTKEQFEQAMDAFAEKLPPSIAHGLAFDLRCLKQDLLPIADLVRDRWYLMAFNQFVARIPEMLCVYGDRYSAEEIGQVFKGLLPIGYDFFDNKIFPMCLQIQINGIRSSKDKISTLNDKAQKILKEIQSTLQKDPRNPDLFHILRFNYQLTTGEQQMRIYFQDGDYKHVENWEKRNAIELCLISGCSSYQGELMVSDSFVEGMAATLQTRLMKEIKIALGVEQRERAAFSPPQLPENQLTPKDKEKVIHFFRNLHKMGNPVQNAILDAFLRQTTGPSPIQIIVRKHEEESKDEQLMEMGCRFKCNGTERIFEMTDALQYWDEQSCSIFEQMGLAIGYKCLFSSIRKLDEYEPTTVLYDPTHMTSVTVDDLNGPPRIQQRLANSEDLLTQKLATLGK